MYTNFVFFNSDFFLLHILITINAFIYDILKNVNNLCNMKEK